MKAEKPNSDITLLVDGREFYCLKDNLSQNSTYFQSMFFSNFVEKDKKEIEIEGFSSADFQLFLDAISDINSITDENVEHALALSTFLGSFKLEEMCMTYLAQGSEIPLKEQFQLAEDYTSENLMIQVCSSIKDAYELDEVVPKDLDSFCNKTKNFVLQRSFELLGIRKPPLPPQSEEPVNVFEEEINELLDQADLQNHHGMILADQTALIEHHIIYKDVSDRELPQAEHMVQQDPRAHELMEELRNTHSPAERNAIRAHILVLKLKIMYTALIEKGDMLDHPWINAVPLGLEELYRIILRNQRKHSKSVPSVRGEKTIDQMYRRIIASVDASIPTEGVPLNNIEPIWVTKITEESEKLLRWEEGVTQNTRDYISETFRRVSEEANFRGLARFVQTARECFYTGLTRREEDNENQNQPEENMPE